MPVIAVAVLLSSGLLGLLAGVYRWCASRALRKVARREEEPALRSGCQDDEAEIRMPTSERFLAVLSNLKKEKADLFDLADKVST